jgi:prepilin-type N-terminal cleavage/methylation domain-containing protein
MNKAFTLSEILITIGIIGVVAVITIPTLITKMKAKELQTQLKHADSVVQNGIGRMVADEVNIPDVFDNADYTTLQKYFKADRHCNMPSSFSDTNYTNYYGKAKASRASAQKWQYPPVCLMDGSFIMFGHLNFQIKDGVYYDSGNRVIMVDINGYDKLPNKYGYDTFFWIFNSKTNRIMPLSTKTTTFDATEAYYRCPPSVGSEAGIGCTLNALSDPNYFSNLEF